VLVRTKRDVSIRDRLTLSTDNWPFEYRPIYKFPPVFWCACWQHIHFVPNSSWLRKNIRSLLEFI